MFSVLLEIVVVFGAALAVTSVSYRLRVPAIIGFLLTGVLIGPSGLALVKETEHVESFAELAVVLMLFLIGLELSRSELRQLGRVFVLGGLMQSLATMGLGALVARWAGATWPLAMFCGFVITLSSTAIVLKLHRDRRESTSPHGRLSLAMLLFQDILIVPMLLIVPLLATGGTGAGEAGIWATLARSGEGLLVVVGVFLVARVLMPRLLGQLAASGLHELLILAALFICLGAALLTHELGLSMALGGFLAGVALADSDLRYQIEAEVGPFRDVFSSIFFTSIGMLLPVALLVSDTFEILTLTLAVVVGKALIVLAATRALGYSLRPALLTALALSQIGEFSFVLLQAGASDGLVPAGLYGQLIAASVLSMLLTPIAIAAAGPLLRRFEPTADRARAQAGAVSRRGHTVIAGCGLNGRHIARVLRQAGKHFELVDVDVAVVREMRSKGDSVLLGDISRRDIQKVAGVPEAAVLVLALSDRDATRLAVRVARELSPSLHLVARAVDAPEMRELLRLGANEVVTQDLETSVEMTRRVLDSLGLPQQAIRSAIGLLKEHHYEGLLAARPRMRLTETMLDVLTAGTAETYVIQPGHWADGATIRQVDLRRRAGATILGVIRGDQVLAHPAADLVFQAGDAVVLAGDHASVADALGLLEGPERA
jgi:CPA2 family monovalent cation:H+ antiporter-2